MHMNSFVSVLIDVLYTKKFNGIICFISSSKYLNETESIHISNPIKFSKSWIMTNNALVFEVSFVDVELVEFLYGIKDKGSYDAYLNRVNVAVARTDLKIKCVGCSVGMDGVVRRATFRFSQW